MSEEQRIITRERLRLLEIGYYIRGGMTAVVSSFFLLYVVMFLAMTFIPDSSWTTESRAAGARQTPAEPEMASPTPSPPAQPPPKFLFRVFAGVMAAFVALGWLLAAATAYAGWCIRKRQKKLFVYLVAALQCIFIPYGTLLGVMTFLTIGSPAGQLEFSDRVS